MNATVDINVDDYELRQDLGIDDLEADILAYEDRLTKVEEHVMFVQKERDLTALFNRVERLERRLGKVLSVFRSVAAYIDLEDMNETVGQKTETAESLFWEVNPPK